MGNRRVVIDTSVFIAHIRATKKEDTVLAKLPAHFVPCISSVTYFELLAGAKDEERRNALEQLLAFAQRLPFDDAVAAKAAEIYNTLKQENKLIEFRDIFIGATAVLHKIPLLTLNKKHFERISGCELLTLNRD